MSTLQIALQHVPDGVTVQAVTLHAAEGIFDTLTQANAKLQGLFRAVGLTAGIGFVVWQGVSSRGAMSRILISMLCAGLFIWGVLNVTEIETRVDNEFNAAGTELWHGAAVGFLVLPGQVPTDLAGQGGRAAPAAALLYAPAA